jgi:NitT/TauT family transport system substrate-binding protein
MLRGTRILTGMNMKGMNKIILIGSLTILFGCGRQSGDQRMIVRLGYFPNMTHAQALIGCASARQDFQKNFGDSARVDTKIFNAGPSAIEALFAGELDLMYIGPNPAINGYVKSHGEAVRIIAGATSGGAVLVARPDVTIKTPADWAGKRIASPQLGNTQDVALRFYLVSHGLQTKEKGGSVTVVPAQNPDILMLFQRKEIDGAWVPEPWGARLVQEAGGTIVLDERDLWPDKRFVTANIVVRKNFLDEHPFLVKQFLKTHVQLTQWIVANSQDARSILNSEIQRITGKALPAEVLNTAWTRMDCTYDPIKVSLFTSADRAYELGFLGNAKPDLSGIFDLRLLNEVLSESHLPAIE